jgi:hypothetical protein
MEERVTVSSYRHLLILRTRCMKKVRLSFFALSDKEIIVKGKTPWV